MLYETRTSTGQTQLDQACPWAVLLLAASCQSFRPAEFKPSDADQARDRPVGQIVETVGAVAYQVGQIVP